MLQLQLILAVVQEWVLLVIFVKVDHASLLPVEPSPLSPRDDGGNDDDKGHQHDGHRDDHGDGDDHRLIAPASATATGIRPKHER